MFTTRSCTSWCLLVACVLALGLGSGGALTACGSGGGPGTQTASASASPGSPTPSSSVTYTNADWYKIGGNPDAFKGATVVVTGKVFSEPEYDTSGVAFQMFTDPQSSEGNTVVLANDPNLKVTTDDYVRVTGTIKGAFDGENAMGGTVSATTVSASAVQKIGALAAAPPAVASITGAKSDTQFGVTVTVRRIEFAESETRVFVSFANKSNGKVSIYANTAQAVQNGRAFSPEFSSAGYPEPESDLPRGTRTSGVIVFKPVKPDKPVRLVFEGYHSDWTKTLKPFVITMK